MKIIETVDVIVTDGESQILLVERGKEPFKGKLVLPGGHIDLTDASPAHAAVRELSEEAGLDVAPERLRFIAKLDAAGRDPRGNYVSHLFGIELTPNALAAARAGSDATCVVLRDWSTVRPEEMGFDHYDAILLLSLRSFIRDVPNFPKPGITFKDITPLLGNAKAFAAAVDRLTLWCRESRPSAVVALESRGFIFGAAVAKELGCAFVPVRKPGKLPAQTERVTYDLEYGSGTLEIHADAFPKGTRVIIVDDLLATGGTAAAATTLVERLGGTVVGYGFVVELLALEGRTKLRDGAMMHSLLKY